MAIVINPALSLDASGNLGGICYSRWRSLQVARAAWTGTQTATALQVERQTTLISISQAWGSTLTAGQRAAWQVFAAKQTRAGRLGTKFIPTGFNEFVRRNFIRAFHGLSLLTVPPVADQAMLASRLVINLVGTAYSHVALRLDPSGGTVVQPIADSIEYWAYDYNTHVGYHPRDCDYRWVSNIASGAGQDFSYIPSGYISWWKARTVRYTGIRGPFFETSYQN